MIIIKRIMIIRIEETKQLLQLAVKIAKHAHRALDINTHGILLLV
jgi:hypothetical protein